ncbi:sigma-54 dependent transcriptional regulator [Pseudomonas sp. JS3066]|jgi:two-component system C4-dicarboxylate transport response regulator DctD|uniref:sigma-54-dependent transcriptional regulator n=1 Tax=unclassified Pseudomonas TaxID=196821 RepID=UPI000EA8FDF9|nr:MULTISPECIES: sigma-54 dependent transcriptional regulator [unclassified Pseudomonas]AYF89592.1 sigma-54-dependent Fis family transcriptional regulator [Pseudomonas sp. DY-1]MDH4656137.1 sigma-54-dependent Fis family transcriptional regulator [Pseudomonas sp. BN606]MRK21254.1 sigma-54-dependent Fis family transcriptional regulator [Pseudomonas sp. JG-B]WVK92853.1 sigma-54 dependent transcriptional regulator [Pseudomonas sp. JS3066]
MTTALDARTQVLLIDDDPHLRQALSQTLDLAGLKVQTLGDAQGVAEKIDKDWPGVVVTDIRMPGIDGLELLKQLRERDPDLPVLLITGHGDVPLAVQAMRAGAYDFLEKPFPSDQLLDSVHRALDLRRLVLENRSLRMALSDRQQLSGRLVGQSPAMQRLREQIGALAATNADVLILGETGAGKEVVARALHDLSARRDGPFVAINAGALAESVVESELFGHEQGAFTGAQKRRIGKFEFANGGTVFLDEIESMSLDVQVKLLRLLQERVVERLGANQLIPLDIRVIAATKEDLRHAADQGRFRADLYYRLNVASLRIPPLRERGEDALTLFQHFADAARNRHGMAQRSLDSSQRALLLTHGWPGNVRELQNAAERFALGLDLNLDNTPADLPKVEGGLSEQVEAFERALIAAELTRPHGSLRSVAEALGLPRKTLSDKLRKHSLSFSGGNPAEEQD